MFLLPGLFCSFGFEGFSKSKWLDFILFIFFLCHVACGILVDQQGIKLASPVLEAHSLNHWTTREVPWAFFGKAPIYPGPSHICSELSPELSKKLHPRLKSSVSQPNEISFSVFRVFIFFNWQQTADTNWIWMPDKEIWLLHLNLAINTAKKEKIGPKWTPLK